MKYSKENMPPIGLIFSDSGGSYEIMKIVGEFIVLNEINSRREYNYSLNGGIRHLNNGIWTIKKTPILDYEIY